MIARLRILAQDHCGTEEERNAIADALNTIKDRRTRLTQPRSSGR